jgi:DNA-binding NarL/FixJ family response regulator
MQSSAKQSLSPVRVYVVAENRLLRETLVRLFRKRSEISVVGDTCCSDSAIAEIASAKSDLLLLDCFNNSASDDWLADLRESIPEIKIVLFGMDEDPSLFLRAVRLGIAGYVLKNASATDLLDAVRTVAHGEATCPTKFCKVLFKTVASGAADEKDSRATAQFELTQRQRQLMSLVAMGLSNKEIAANLNLSEFTVKNHIYRVMKQVDAQSRHEAVTLIRDSD